MPARTYSLLKITDVRYVIAIDDLAVARCTRFAGRWLADWIVVDNSRAGWANGLMRFVRMPRTHEAVSFTSPAAVLGHVIRVSAPVPA